MIIYFFEKHENFIKPYIFFLFLKYMGKLVGAGAAQKSTGSATLILRPLSDRALFTYGTGTLDLRHTGTGRSHIYLL
jgi:hypothetical protein